MKDPYGLKGEPQYLGASLPLDGYGIVNLSLSENGQTLIGQFKGGFSTHQADQQQKPHLNMAWRTQGLIDAALANQRPMQEHFRIETQDSQFIQVPAYANGWVGDPVTTAFDPPAIELKLNGNMGDVMEVDLADLVARKLNKLPLPGESNRALTAYEQQLIALTKDKFSHFFAGSLTDWSQCSTQVPDNGFKIIGEPDANGKLNMLSLGGDDFEKSGVFYAAPNITEKDVADLRAGQRVEAKKANSLTFFCVMPREWKADAAAFYPIHPKTASSPEYVFQQITLNLSATDVQGQTLFIGDRPLDNPGYSAMTLSASVGEGQTNSILDVYKVEQRLKYLGYGVSNIGNSGEIEVNGTLSDAELIVLRQFDQIVSGQNEYNPSPTAPLTGTTGETPRPLVNKVTYQDLNWLNAYNAPHWVNYAGELKNKLDTGWVDKTSAGTRQNMGTSWVFDLMLAGQKAAQAQGRPDKLWFAGTGSLGTRLNLGINTQYVGSDIQAHGYGDEFMLGLSDANSVDLKSLTASNAPNATPQEKLKYLLQERDRIKQSGNGVWSYQSAQELANLLQNINRTTPAANKPNNQTDAMRDFIALFSATQKDSTTNNGSWEEQLSLIKSGGTDAKNKQIQQMLFGDGTLAGGMIDANNLLIGGVGKKGGNLGAELTAQSLAAIMGNKANVNYQEWVAPMNEAMKKFNINTPKRVAAFLNQVSFEMMQMSSPAEDTNWVTKIREAGNFRTASEAIIQQYLQKTADEKADYAFFRPSMDNTQTDDGHK